MLSEVSAGAVSVCCIHVRNTAVFFSVVPTSSTILVLWDGRYEIQSVITSVGWAKHCCCTAVKSHCKPPSLNQVRSLLKASIPFLNLVSVQLHTFMQISACGADSLSQKQSKFKWSSANRVQIEEKKKTSGHQRRCSPWGEDKVKTERVTCWLIGSARLETLPYLFILLQRRAATASASVRIIYWF